MDQLIQVERAPATRLLVEQNTANQRHNSYNSIKTQLGILQSRVDKLQNPEFFNGRVGTSSDATVATVSGSTKASNGSYSLNVVALATQSEWRGVSDVGAAIAPTNDVSGLALSDAGFSTAVGAGDFTVNGKRITLATSDTLQQVFDKIATATSNAVTASYDATNDRISLSGSGTITLGSATDTSNFLQVAKLYNNGTAAVSSATRLGGVRSASALESANFTTPVSDGGSGAGQFKINGVAIAFNRTEDTLAEVVQRINESDAGVSASYDSVNDRLVLRNKTTGDLGVSLEDVTGNFLAATGLTGGSLQRGANLRYTLDGGAELISTSNTISEASSGLTGVTINALKLGTTQLAVASDTATVSKGISDFLEEYNKLQTLIDRETASSTDSKGKVSTGTLADESDADTIGTQLRRLAYSAVSNLSGTIDKLAQLGIDSNGTDSTLKIGNATTLDSMLKTKMDDVRELFTDTTDGLAVRLHKFVENTIGDDGTLIKRQAALTKQSNDIDKQVSDLERLLETRRQAMISSFVAMETAQQKINEQLKFITQRFGT